MSLRSTLLLLPLLLLGASSCKKSDHNGQAPTTMYYRQTQCADVWGYGSTDAETATTVQTYFRNRNIPIGQVSVAADGTPETCNACFCKTGKTIYAQVSEAYITEYKSYGFAE